MELHLLCLEWNTYLKLIMHEIFDFVKYCSSINRQLIPSYLQTFGAQSIHSFQAYNYLFHVECILR